MSEMTDARALADHWRTAATECDEKGLPEARHTFVLCADQLDALAARLRGDGEQGQAVATFVDVKDGQRQMRWHTDDVDVGAKLYARPQPVAVAVAVAGDAVRALLNAIDNNCESVTAGAVWDAKQAVEAALSTQPAPSEANSNCPKCKAPCKRTVNMRGGDYGWSTTDEERAEYRYVQPAPSAPVVDEAMVERALVAAYGPRFMLNGAIRYLWRTGLTAALSAPSEQVAASVSVDSVPVSILESVLAEISATAKRHGEDSRNKQWAEWLRAEHSAKAGAYHQAAHLLAVAIKKETVAASVAVPEDRAPCSFCLTVECNGECGGDL